MPETDKDEARPDMQSWLDAFRKPSPNGHKKRKRSGRDKKRRKKQAANEESDDDFVDVFVDDVADVDDEDQDDWIDSSKRGQENESNHKAEHSGEEEVETDVEDDDDVLPISPKKKRKEPKAVYDDGEGGQEISRTLSLDKALLISSFQNARQKQGSDAQRDASVKVVGRVELTMRGTTEGDAAKAGFYVVCPSSISSSFTSFSMSSSSVLTRKEQEAVDAKEVARAHAYVKSLGLLSPFRAQEAIMFVDMCRTRALAHCVLDTPIAVTEQTFPDFSPGERALIFAIVSAPPAPVLAAETVPLVSLLELNGFILQITDADTHLCALHGVPSESSVTARHFIQLVHSLFSFAPVANAIASQASLATLQLPRTAWEHYRPEGIQNLFRAECRAHATNFSEASAMQVCGWLGKLAREESAPGSKNDPHGSRDRDLLHLLYPCPHGDAVTLPLCEGEVPRQLEFE